MWDPGNKHRRGGGGFAAGPPQGKLRLLGGQRSTRSDKRGGHVRGFTLLELLLVVGIIAMVGAGVGFALRDTGQSQLEREAQRLVALLEAARAQSRASGLPVYWHADVQGFEFVGLPPPKTANDGDATQATGKTSTTPWLGDGTSVRDGAVVTLGPEPIIERTQIVLLQANRSLRIATDGLRPFAVQAAGADEVAGTNQ